MLSHIRIRSLVFVAALVAISLLGACGPDSRSTTTTTGPEGSSTTTTTVDD